MLGTRYGRVGTRW